MALGGMGIQVLHVPPLLLGCDPLWIADINIVPNLKPLVAPFCSIQEHLRHSIRATGNLGPVS